MSIYAESLAKGGAIVEETITRNEWHASTQESLGPADSSSRMLRPVLQLADVDPLHVPAVTQLALLNIVDIEQRTVLLNKYTSLQNEAGSPDPSRIDEILLKDVLDESIDRAQLIDNLKRITAFSDALLADKAITEAINPEDPEEAADYFDEVIQDKLAFLLERLVELSDFLPSGVVEKIEQSIYEANIVPLLAPAHQLAPFGEFMADTSEYFNGFYYGLEDTLALNYDMLEWHEYDLFTIVIIHELIHRAAGGTFVLSKDFGPVDETRLRGGFAVDIEGLQRKENLDEAATEIIACSIFEAKTENIATSSQMANTSPYFEQMKILEHFIDESRGIVTLQDFIAAYFEDTEPGVQPVARRRLIKNVREAYGPGALRKLEAIMNSPLSLEEKLGHIALSDIRHPAQN